LNVFSLHGIKNAEKRCITMVSPRVKKWARALRTFTHSLRGVSRLEKELFIRNTRASISPRERVKRMRKVEQLKILRGHFFSPTESVHYQLSQHLHEQGVPTFSIESIAARSPQQLNSAVSQFVQKAIHEFHQKNTPVAREEMHFYDHSRGIPHRVGEIKLHYDALTRTYKILILWNQLDAAALYREHFLNTVGRWYIQEGRPIWIMDGTVSRSDEKELLRAIIKEKKYYPKRDEYLDRYKKK
jgi:hypothetical protein